MNKKIFMVMLGIFGAVTQAMSSCCSSTEREESYSARVIYAALLAQRKLLRSYQTNPRIQEEDLRPMMRKVYYDLINEKSFIEDMNRDAANRNPNSNRFFALFAINPNIFDSAVPKKTNSGSLESFLAPDHQNPLDRTEERQLAAIRRAFLGEEQLPDLESTIRRLNPSDPKLSQFSLKLPVF